VEHIEQLVVGGIEQDQPADSPEDDALARQSQRCKIWNRGIIAASSVVALLGPVWV
jgi:hypothetical protein